jgi:hypothetical protein
MKMSRSPLALEPKAAPEADNDNAPLTDDETEPAWETKVDLARLLDPDEAASGALVAGRKGRRRPNAQELLCIANARILERCRRHGKIPARRASRS